MATAPHPYLTRPDQNRCEFTCRVMADPELTMKKVSTHSTMVPFVSFPAVCNSSLINRWRATFFDCCAYGKIADELNNRVKKNYDIFIICQLVGTYGKIIQRKGIKLQDKVALFEIKEFAIRRVLAQEVVDAEAKVAQEEDPRDPGQTPPV